MMHAGPAAGGLQGYDQGDKPHGAHLRVSRLTGWTESANGVAESPEISTVITPPNGVD